MVTSRKSRRSRKVTQAALGKPRGIIQDRVQKVGPQRFGIVAVDCAKARSKWMLCDFYGKLLVPPTEVEHARAQMQLAIVQFREAYEKHGLKDAIVAVEMTGTYHRPIQRAFRDAGCETRLVHPFASKHYRVTAHGDIKTDDNDLEGIFRAAVNGFGLIEPTWDELYRHLQLLCRHRRDLVQKRAKLQCQIREYLHRCLPGYAALFPKDSLWRLPVPLWIAGKAITAEAILEARIPGVTAWLRKDKLRFQSRTVEKIVAWDGNAADADPLTPQLTEVWKTLDADRCEKSRRITELEQQIAVKLVKTPYILLLSHPGINVISAADLAAEMGPIEHYAHDRAVTGRAGLFPSRYQSDQVDRTGGSLSRFRNAALRAAWLRVADNLIQWNAHYRGKYLLWKAAGVDARDIRCRIANRAVRPIFQMVYARQLFKHPSRIDRDYVLDKLLKFHEDHKTPPYDIVCNLEEAVRQIPKGDRSEEARPLKQRCLRARRSRRAGPQSMGTLLVGVLARLGVHNLQPDDPASSPDARPTDIDPR
jgi:transposase